MEVSKICLILCLSTAAVGCTKGEPKFEDLDSSSLPQPLFSGRTSTTKQTASAASPYQIDGECDQKVRELVVSVREVSTTPGPLTSFATAITVQCSLNGRFSFLLNGLSALGITPAEGATYHVDLRAVTSGGISQPSVINIRYSTANGQDPKHMLITGGSTESSGLGPRVATSTNYKALIRVSNRAPAYSGTPNADEIERKSSNVIMAPVFPGQSP